MKTRIIQEDRDDRDGPAPPDDPGGTAEPPRAANFAHRVGRWSANHWKTAVFGWLAFVVASFFVGSMVGTKYLEASDSNVGEARTADKIIEAGFPGKFDEQGEMVLIQHATLTADDPTFKAVISDVTRTLDGFPKVRKLNSPLEAGHGDLISDDRHSVMVTFSPKGDYEEAITYIQTIELGMDKVGKSHPGFYVDELGSASTTRELDVVFNGMIKTAGLIAIPLALVILLFVFGSAVGAIAPLLLALTAVFATMGLVAIPSQFFPVDEQIAEVILLIGLAVGIDYSLFYLKREREERAAGRSEGAALEAAAATSGRAVLISGITVLIAMGGMFLSGDKTFMSFSVGTMMVVAVAMIGSLTVLPALLSKLGDRVEKGRIPFVHRLRRKDGEGRFWGAILDRVLKRPVISAVAATAVLVALALPALDLNTANPGIDDIKIAEVEPIKKLIAAFPGGNAPAQVAIRADDVRAEPVRAAIAELEKQAIATGQMKQPIEVEASRDHTVAIVDIPLVGGGTDDVSKDALVTLRDEVLPATVGKVGGVEYAVTGETAADKDWASAMKKSVPLVFGFVLLFAFVILLASFRSIVVALKAIVLNLLSVAAAYGVLVAVFQWGWGESILGFESNGGIAPWLPTFLFVILFGLSMDYHVFILSRVRELYDRGYSNDEAVAHGIKTTAGVVTSAATVMVVTFAVFASLPVIDFKEMGIGLAAAILIDATIVRAVLLPATMKLLGDKNWYLPKWLEWLPHLEHGASPERVERPPVAAPTA
jgi:RND superfamily putative drug exporter